MFLLLSVKTATGQSILLYAETPERSRYQGWYQRLNYTVPADTLLRIQLTSYRLRSEQDSSLLYDLVFREVLLRKGSHFIDLYHHKAASAHSPEPVYFELLQHFGTEPAGQYSLQVYAYNPDSSLFYRRHETLLADTTLSYRNRLKANLNQAFERRSDETAPVRRLEGQLREQSEAQAHRRVSRRLRQLRQGETRKVTELGHTYSYIYYKGWLLGRYELAPSLELSGRVAAEQRSLSAQASGQVDNELEHFRSVRSQVRDLYAVKGKEKGIEGQLDLSSNRNWGQDPGSAIAPDFTEVLANLNVELLGLPVSIEGFYTTQDQDRQAKASYLRLHYDVATAKDRLQQLIGGYRQKMQETIAKGPGLEQVYTNYSDGLLTARNRQLGDLGRDYGLPRGLKAENLAALNRITDSLGGIATDSAAALRGRGQQHRADSIQAVVKAQRERIGQDRQKIQARYEELEALVRKADKYKALLAQYQDQARLDSAITYTRIQALGDGDASYKDMAKAAGDLLPEGRAKTFAAGLTSLDIGIINKYESNYTMAGQTLKGISLGYDLGPLKAGITGGSTEYVSRDGRPDRYNSVLLRLDSKGLKHHNIGLVYQGSTPSKSLLQDEQFKGASQLAYPSFTAPTHVLSLVYEATPLRQLNLAAELAHSFKNGRPGSPDLDHAALNTTAEYLVPGTSLSLKGGWEHLGAAFENNTLPYIRTATERYTVGAGLDLFRSFLSLKLDYNQLAQRSFSGTGYNRKWGFDIRTHSRRYPNISLSYKPFSTFRSYTDTLNIPGRPMYGSVWTGRGSYQFKRLGHTHRFSIVYSNNSSHSDSANYTSSNLQLSYQYSAGQLNLSGSIGWISLPSDYQAGDGQQSSYLAMSQLSRSLGRWQLSFGPELGITAWGLQRLSGTGGCQYQIPRQQLALRLLLRYTQYRTAAETAQQTVCSGQLGANWRFKSRNRNNSK